jgi:hypothetical protein
VNELTEGPKAIARKVVADASFMFHT